MPRPSIVFIGDSLTYGTADGVRVDRPYPLSVAETLECGSWNHGMRGYIPRHAVWNWVIKFTDVVLIDDLLAIPPTQREDRINQPTVNNLRTFYANGKRKWVGDPSDMASAVLYEFSASSTAAGDGVNVLVPTWIADNNPTYAAGRWIKKAGVLTPPVNSEQNGDFVLWLGANGMEVADTIDAINLVRRHRGIQQGRVSVLTLVNRQPYNAAQSLIDDWALWIGQVNDAIRTEFAVDVIDLQSWMFGPEYGAAEPNDLADIARGIVPRSIKDQGQTGTHFTQSGYEQIAAFVAESI